MDRRRVGPLVVVAATCGVMACGDGDDDGRSDHGYVVRRAFASGDTLYLGGSFREPRNAAGNQLTGHEMMVVLDASDPTAPSFVAEIDMKATVIFGMLDGKLLAVQHGIDEEMLDQPSPPIQDVRLKVYDLTDLEAPSLEKTIVLPDDIANTAGWTAHGRMLDDEHVLVTIADGNEDGSSTVTWIVRPGAPAGSEVVGETGVGCRVPALDGTTLWCVPDELSSATLEMVGFTLGDDGSLTEIARAPVVDWDEPFDQLLIPTGAAFAEPGGTLVVADNTRGTFSLWRDVDAVPSVIGSAADFDGAETSVLVMSNGRVVVQTQRGIHVVHPDSLEELSAMAIPGEFDSNHSGGFSLARLGEGSSLDGLIAASLGDFGVVLLQEDGDDLEQVGGYYRRFGTDLPFDDDLTEGNW